MQPESLTYQARDSFGVFNHALTAIAEAIDIEFPYLGGRTPITPMHADRRKLIGYDAKILRRVMGNVRLHCVILQTEGQLLGLLWSFTNLLIHIRSRKTTNSYMLKGKAKQPSIPTALEIVQGLDLSGKVFVITGAYSGLEAATTKALLTAGAKVIVAGRNPKSQEDFVRELTTSKDDSSSPVCDANLIDATHTIDLGSLASVRNFANYVKTSYDSIDCLINNAGVMNTPAGVTKDGFKVQMGTNVIGHFLLAKILASITKRQVRLSSTGHALNGRPPGNHDYTLAPRIDLDAIRKVDERTYDGWKRY
ncbi:MAG: SDR family NAD(P)-dependent oxidoreductase [Kovacikia sp.]